MVGPLKPPCQKSSMAVSLNSVISFNPTANYQQVTRTSNIRLLSQKVPSIPCLSGPVGLRSQCTQRSRTVHFLPAAGADNVATETSDNDSKSDNKLSNVNSSTKAESTDEVGGPNGAVKEASSPVAAKPRSSLKTPVTVRERLRAARVLSRYTESKPLKPEERGNKLLKALQDGTEKTGKQRSGLPEAPTNLLDDSKRGMPKQGWTINIIPEGMDVFLIIISFVFISTVMFATTFLVWKLGAIHFNEY